MREEHDLAIGEFKGIMVSKWMIQVDLPEPGDCVADALWFLFKKTQLKSPEFTLDLFRERDLRARKSGRRHTATLGSPGGENPRVVVFQNSVVTKSSPTLARRDVTPSKL
jgi:hypothetical protein